MTRKNSLIVGITLITLMGGLMNLYMAVRPAPLAPHPLLREIVPFEFFHIQRSFGLLIGFALVFRRSTFTGANGAPIRSYWRWLASRFYLISSKTITDGRQSIRWRSSLRCFTPGGASQSEAAG